MRTERVPSPTPPGGPTNPRGSGHRPGTVGDLRTSRPPRNARPLSAPAPTRTGDLQVRRVAEGVALPFLPHRSPTAQHSLPIVDGVGWRIRGLDPGTVWGTAERSRRPHFGDTLRRAVQLPERSASPTIDQRASGRHYRYQEMAQRARQSQRSVPWTPRPITPAQLRAIEAGRAAIRRGDYVSLEEAEKYVARERAKPTQGRRNKIQTR